MQTSTPLPDEVDAVIHYDPPGDHKTYLHRSGRTARAGESGVVVTLLLWNQELEVKRLLKRIGVDPAVASAVFVLTLIDLTGFFVFLGLATLILI